MKKASMAKAEPQNRKLDTYRLVFDLMKHLTTLSSGSILLLITILEKVLRDTPPVMPLRFAFIGFCGSIIASVVAMVLLAFNAAEGDITEDERIVFAWASTLSSMAFVAGIIATVVALVPGIR